MCAHSHNTSTLSTLDKVFLKISCGVFTFEFTFEKNNNKKKKTLVSLSSDKQVECVSFLMEHSQIYFGAYMLTSMYASYQSALCSHIATFLTITICQHMIEEDYIKNNWVLLVQTLPRCAFSGQKSPHCTFKGKLLVFLKIVSTYLTCL